MSIALKSIQIYRRHRKCFHWHLRLGRNCSLLNYFWIPIEEVLHIVMLLVLITMSVFFFRVLCALVNSFVPETFTTEVLLNDRCAIKCYSKLIFICNKLLKLYLVPAIHILYYIRVLRQYLLS